MGIFDVIAIGVVGVPVVYGLLYAVGTQGIGPLQDVDGFLPTGWERSGSPTADATTEAAAAEPPAGTLRTFTPRGPPSGLLLVFGLLTLPFGWGIPILVYAFRNSGEEKYAITESALVKYGSSLEEYPLAEISQIQVQQTIPERLRGTGILKFRHGKANFVQISGVDDYRDVARELQAQADEQ